MHYLNAMKATFKHDKSLKREGRGTITTLEHNRNCREEEKAPVTKTEFLANLNIPVYCYRFFLLVAIVILNARPLNERPLVVTPLDVRNLVVTPQVVKPHNGRPQNVVLDARPLVVRPLINVTPINMSKACSFFGHWGKDHIAFLVVEMRNK